MLLLLIVLLLQISHPVDGGLLLKDALAPSQSVVQGGALVIRLGEIGVHLKGKCVHHG